MHSRFLRLLLPVLLLSAVTARAQTPPAATPPPAEFPLSAYADIGFMFGDNGKFDSLGWTEEQFESFLSGLRDAYRHKPREFGPAAQALNASISRRLQEVQNQETQSFKDYLRNPAHLETYMKEMCTRMNLERSDSGLAYGVQGIVGSVRPQPEDTVVLTWNVRAADMKSELKPLNVEKKTFKVSELLPGLAEGVQMMTVGSAAMLILPPDLSYGSGEWPKGLDTGLPLVFMVKLEQVIPAS